MYKNCEYNIQGEFICKKKIAICMWYDDEIKEYGDIAKKINKKYCDEMGYDLIYSNKRYLKDRHPSWEKIPLLLNILKTNKYDYVMWIDADACFRLNLKNKNYLEDLINKNNTKDIIFSQDHDHDCENCINCGVIIFKNTLYSKNILNYIIKNNFQKCIKHYIVPNWEQECILDIYSNNYENIKDHSVIIPYGELQVFWNNNKTSLIIHFPARSKKDRINELNKLRIEFGLN